jgi:hypothetical protein
MPKSRHGRGKHPHYSKKSKALRRQGTPGPAPAISQAAAGMPDTPGQVAPAVPRPAPKVASMAATKVAVNPYPFITSELRTIAILGGIIVVILVVLSLLLK